MSHRSSSKKDPQHPHIWMLAVAVFVMALSFFQFPAVQTSAAGLNFSFLKGFSFFRIDFSQLFNSELFLKHSTSLMNQRDLDCTEISEACKREYRRCLGTLKDADQYADVALQRARNGCIYSCAGEPEPCFGLDLETALNPPPPPPPVFTCNGPQGRSCLASNGQSGTQMATSCDSSTGQWNFGECEISIQTCSPESEPFCSDGYVGSYVCENGIWVNRCKVAIPCTFSYTPWSECERTGFSTCYRRRITIDEEPPNCNWPPPIISEACSCPNYGPCGKEPDPNYRVCEQHMGLGMRYGKEILTCNTNTKQWVYRVCNSYPATQPKCTSFTYTDWSACGSDGKGGYYQSRKVVDSDPYGCFYYTEDVEIIQSCEL